MIKIILLRVFTMAMLVLSFGGTAAEEAAGERVLINTSLGNIEIVVYSDQAPVTANNFLRLVDGGHFDGGSFYRTVSPRNDHGSPVISVIQGGVADAEGPFDAIEHESTELTGIRHRNGVVSMARAEVGTASTEIFICIGAQPALDFGGQRNPDGQGFAAFGEVVKGMDVVRAIHRQPADAPVDSEYVAGQILTEPVEIISIERID